MVHVALYAFACLPVLHVMLHAAGASRNIVYWDEFDTVLRFALRLDEPMTLPQFVRDLFAVSNEHRLVTSRLLTAFTYWILGTIDFQILSALGNGSLVALAALLVWTAQTPERRVRLALVLGFGLFHLAHFENLQWPGSSIDHFTIVFVAAAAIVALARGSGRALLVGMGLSALATFTLAHGIMTWPVGAAMLWHAKRRQHLVAWCAAAALVGLGFALGFKVNPGHSFADTSLAGLGAIGLFWLRLLGAIPSVGHMSIAPWAGLVLLALVVWAGCNGAARRERVLFPLTWFALAATALIAVGRAQEGGGAVHSRYLILSALAWSLTAYMLLERYSHSRRPLRLTLFVLPVLIGFNIATDRAFADEADSWIECRDRAAVRFIDTGRDGEGAFKLYPNPDEATRLLTEGERRGVYRMPPVCEEREFANARPSSRIQYFVEGLEVDASGASVTGWAAIPGRYARRGSLYLVLRSDDKMHVYSTVAISRPDVVQAMKQPRWLRCGFRFARSRDRLPAGEYQVGFLIARNGKAEYIMTAHRVNLDGAGKAYLATGN